MKIQYDGEAESRLIPTAEDWDKSLDGKTSADTNKISGMLCDFDKHPGLDALLEINAAAATLAAAEKPGGAAEHLQRDVKAVLDRAGDRSTLMARIESRMQDALPWQTQCLCAELYHDNPIAFDGLCKDGNEVARALEEECRLTSGWAMLAPKDFAAFYKNGADDAESVRVWPKLTGKTTTLFKARNIAWPPKWDETKPWRKGLFCHSSAAIAAWFLDANRSQLTSGMKLPIKSMDIVQQMPVVKGGMSHWWVAVNRPDVISSGTGPVNVDELNDWTILDLVGGFIIDIWGALWINQAGRPEVWATNKEKIAQNAVKEDPFIRLGETDSEKTRVHVRKVYA